MTSGDIREKARKQRAGDRVGAWFQGGRVISFNWDKAPLHSRILMESKGNLFLGVYDKDIQKGWLEEDIMAMHQNIVELTRANPAVTTSL